MALATPGTTAGNFYQAETPYLRDWQWHGNEGYISGNTPGENELGRAAMFPLSQWDDLLVGSLQSNTPNMGTSLSQMLNNGNYAADLERVMGIDTAGQSQMVNNYNRLAQPVREQQSRGLADTMAAMGMGGGRGARALAGMQRGFANDTGQYAQSVANNAAAVKQQIGQILSGAAGNQFNADTAQQQQWFNLLGQNRSQMSNVPLSAFAAFNRGESQ